MRVKKMFQGKVPENKILSTYSDSQTDTYSCDYTNKTNEWKYHNLSENPIISNTNRTIELGYTVTEIALVCWNANKSWQSYCTVTLPVLLDSLVYTTGKTKNDDIYKIDVKRTSNTNVYIVCGYEHTDDLKITGFYYR